MSPSPRFSETLSPVLRGIYGRLFREFGISTVLFQAAFASCLEKFRSQRVEEPTEEQMRNCIADSLPTQLKVKARLR